jgi:hypothetical protein
MRTQFAARVGFHVSEATSWFRPFLMFASWPAGNLQIDPSRIRVSIPVLGEQRIPWSHVTSVDSRWLGLRTIFSFEQAAVPHELIVHGPLINRRIRNFLTTTGLSHVREACEHRERPGTAE